jgi:hypothetical protein
VTPQLNAIVNTIMHTDTASDLPRHLRKLRLKRRALKKRLAGKRRRREVLSSAERQVILEKTGRRCHICGGEILDEWHADHVLAHSSGGRHTTDNYLPAHALCNNYRWDYTAEEFQYILKLGVWIRTLIERGSPLGLAVTERFVQYELGRECRRKRPKGTKRLD